MASFRAIHSVGESLRVYLQASYPRELRDAFPCTFQVLSSGQLARFEDPTESSVALTLFLYRATVSEHARHARLPGSSMHANPSLPLELHWMMTVWAASAAAEHIVFAWAMHQLHVHPLLDEGTLTSDGGWEPGDTVQVIPEELPVESLMRIWDSLEPTYRLSSSYVARVVRIGAGVAKPDRPIVSVGIVTGGRTEDAG